MHESISNIYYSINTRWFLNIVPVISEVVLTILPNRTFRETILEYLEKSNFS